MPTQEDKELVKSALQEKVREFEKTLTSHEVLRLAQLRGTDPQGNLLEGQACFDEAQRRIAGQPHMSNEFKLTVQASLDSKLKDFEKLLSDAEMAQLLCQLGTKPFKVQSSYGLCD